MRYKDKGRGREKERESENIKSVDYNDMMDRWHRIVWLDWKQQKSFEMLKLNCISVNL